MRDDSGAGRKIIPFRGKAPQAPPRFPFRLTTLVLAGLLVGQALQTGCAATSRRSENVAARLDLSEPQLARGQAVFDRHCSQCHPGGEGGLAPSINNKPLPGFLIRLQVRAGMGAMPAFPPSRLSDPDLDALVAYMVALREAKPDPERTAPR